MNQEKRLSGLYPLALSIAGVLFLSGYAVMADDQAKCLTFSFAPLDDTVPACARLIESGELGDTDLYQALMARAVALEFAMTYHFGHTIDPQALLESQHADLDRSVAISRRLHAVNESHPALLQRALAERASVNAQLGRHDRAVQDYSESIDLGDTPAIMDLMGRSLSLERLGRLEAAIRDMSTIIQVSDGPMNLANSFVRRAELHEAAGHTKTAIVDYRHAVGLRPNHTVATKALERLGANP